MKRLLEEDKEEEDLQRAIEQSLLTGEDQEEEEDEDLQRVLEQSLVTQQRKMDIFYSELQESVKKKRRLYEAKQEVERQCVVASENNQYNREQSSIITVDLILARILKYANLSVIAALYRTSKNMRELVEATIKRFPIRSVCVESSNLFSTIAFRYRWGVCLFALIVPTLDTIRFKMVGAKLPYNASPHLAYRICPHIKHLILCVEDDEQVKWFHRNHSTTNGTRRTIFYEQGKWRIPTTERVYSKVYIDDRLEILEVLSLFGGENSSPFSSYSNFNSCVEEEEEAFI